MFLALLQQRVEQLGGSYSEVPTRTTKLSQSCHCGASTKKTLNHRWHKCTCGAVAQRDLYSAFLCMFVEGDTLNHKAAQDAWKGVEPVLTQCMKDIQRRKQEGERLPSSFGV